MRAYIAPKTEITMLRLSEGVMQGDDNLDFNNAVSVEGGDVQSNSGTFFDDEMSMPTSSNLWDD
ncbi:MAG: hypothetical protein IJK08_09590 [Prevotella sp.]|nr:hypothetical protein [Prevotella sp.]